MANYTEHYQLHQWEGSDSFLRTDFNEDLKKVDLAIWAAKSASGCIEGTFTGNGDQTEISLGVRPKFVAVTAPHKDSSRASDIRLALGTEHCMISFDSYSPAVYSKITFQDTGFTIEDGSDDGLNGAGQNNGYAAFY